MKRKILFIVMMLAFTGLFTMQSCNKDEVVTLKEFHAFTDPVAVAPANEATVTISGTTVDLTWESTNADNNAPLADVYFGTSETPPLYKAGHNSLTLNVPVELGLTYYWHVTMKDAHGLITKGPTWSFTVFEPIGIFVGDFNCDEPAEDYSYDVSFEKTSPVTLETANYWNSGWAATFTLDFAANTYSMPLTVWGNYSSIESGTIDPETGTMVGDYIIYYKEASIEEGVHTYTKY
ncbi:MAG: hypothetical protein WCS03_15535 [Bacteroidota bacterium]